MYICVQKSKEEFDVDGNSLGQSGDNALYYLRELGTRRIYRQSYPKPEAKGLMLYKYKRKINAQKLCDYINQFDNNNYEVIEIEE